MWLPFIKLSVVVISIIYYIFLIYVKLSHVYREVSIQMFYEYNSLDRNTVIYKYWSLNLKLFVYSL